MGSKGSSGTNTVTSSSAPPAAVMANYQSVTNQAQNVAATPYQAYTGQEVAPLNAQQTAAGTEAANAVGAYQPYFNTAQNMITQGTQAITPTTVNSADINQYMSPYNTSVINATEAQMNQNDQTQQQQLTGNAISAGAFGGDRAAVAASTLAGQQDLANNQTIAGLENSNYTQALGEANTQQQAGMTAQQATAANELQGSGLTGALGNYSETNQLNAASANEAAGQVAQGTQQAQDTAAYQQFEQALQYPFQTTGWLAGIDTGTGGASGGTSSTTSPAPSIASQATGLGVTGLGVYGAMNSPTAKRGGPIRGYASGGSPSGMPDFSVSYVPNAPSFGGGSTMLKPSGSQSSTTGTAIPQLNAGVVGLAGKGIKSLLGSPTQSMGAAPGAGTIASGLTPAGEQGLVTGANVPATGGVSISGGTAGGYSANDIFGSGFTPSSSAAGDIMWDNPAAGVDSGIVGSLGMGDVAGESAMADLTGGADAAITDAGIEAGAADLGESAIAADAGDAIAFAKRGGPIKRYASGGSASAPSYPLSYLLQNPTFGTNMNSVMGGGYGGALSGLGPTSAGYSSGGGIMPKKYATSGFVPPPPMTSGGIGTGNVGDSIPYMAINNVPGVASNDPTSGFNWGNTSPSNYTPMSTQSMAAAPSAQGIPSAPSINGQSTMGANGPMSTAGSSGIAGTPSTDSSGTTTIAGVPALGSSTSGQPQDLTDLEAKLQANAPVLDKNEALMEAGLSMMSGKDPHALVNIGAGGLEGVKDYAQQKAAVRDYGLKEAEVEDRAKQMQVEAEKFKQQMQIEQENADTNKGYKDIVGNAATQKVPVNDQIYAGLKQKQVQSNGVYTDDDLNKDYADIQQRMSVPRNAEISTARQIQTANPGMSAEDAATRATQALATGTQNAHVAAAEQISTNSATGKMLPEVQDRWNKQALAGETAKNNIQNIMTDIQGFDPAWGAATKLEAKRALQGISSNLGVDTPDLDKSVASQQMMNKTVNSMIMSTMGAQSSKWTNAEMGNIGKANPTDTMSPQAIKGIAVQAKAPFDYYEGIAKVINDPKYVSQYRTNNNGSTMGIENDVQSRVSPIAYSYMRMSPDDKQKFYKSLDSGSQTKLRDEVNFMGNNKITPTD